MESSDLHLSEASNRGGRRKLTRGDLFPLEEYARRRPEFRNRVIEHKKNRRVQIGPHAALYFEDALTIQYQVQEMLRVERIFEPAEIESELDAYNPLIPGGRDLKATFMLEYADIEERHRALAQMVNIEDRLWLRVGEREPVWAIADEDLDRETAEKTSAVHFVRFELSDAMVAGLNDGEPLAFGIDHDAYRHHSGELPEPIRRSLLADFD